MIIPSLVLTNTNPVITYTASVVTSGSILADGLGNQLTSLQLTSSYSTTASYFSPSQGVITDAGPLTGSVSASGYGFTTDVEFNTFVTSVSSSFQQLDVLLAKLRAAGLIS